MPATSVKYEERVVVNKELFTNAIQKLLPAAVSILHQNLEAIRFKYSLGNGFKV